jgi:thymidine kinase
MAKNGYLEIAVGSMFSGKTEWIQNKYNMYKSSNKILVINNHLDTRYSLNEVVSHSGFKIPCISVKELNSLLNNKDTQIEEYDIVLINEAQFFEDLVSFVKNILNKNKKIYISGLDGDFRQNKFGYILDLIPLCDSVIKLKANCMNCKKENCAIFSHRIVNNNNEQTLIGSNESYIATCRDCYNILTK